MFISRVAWIGLRWGDSIDILVECALRERSANEEGDSFFAIDKSRGS